MTLIIKGFDKQAEVTADEAVLLLKQLPVSHLKGLRYVVFDPTRFFQRSYVSPVIPNRSIKGQYYPEMLDAIILYEIKDKESFQHILLHEIGHYVFQRILSSVQKKDWVTRLYSQSVFVSEYAKTNAQEDFAETYAFYMQKKAFGYALQPKYHFLNSIS